MNWSPLQIHEKNYLILFESFGVCDKNSTHT